MSSGKSVGRALHWLEGKIAYSVGFGVFAMLAVGAILFYFHERAATRTQVVRVGYGAGAPVRKRFLEQMASEGQKYNLDIRLVGTEGTDDTLNRIDRGDADLGLIAGVVEDRGSRKVLELTPLYMEPLQLLVRAEHYEAVLKDFGQLRGKTIDLDSQDSATNLLATELLRFMGLTDPATGRPQYQAVNIPQLRLTDGTPVTSLPDVIFQIGGVPSASIRNLIARHDYRLVPLPFGESFNLDRFRDAETLDANSKLRLNKRFIEEAVIPAFVYSVLPPVPPEDTRSISTRLTLVGSARLENLLVHKVLELIFSPEVSGFSNPALSVELLNTKFQFERHPGTDLYRNSLKPVDVEGALTAFTDLAEIYGLIIALYIGAAKGLKVWKQRRLAEHAAVGDFLEQVMAVEAEAGAACTAAERITLDQRLTDIKKKSLELHLKGLLDDEEDLQNLLVTLADTRTRIWGPVS